MRSSRILVEGPDGNIVSFETEARTREAQAEEVGRYFPQATGWRSAGNDLGRRVGALRVKTIVFAIVVLISLGLLGSTLNAVRADTPSQSAKPAEAGLTLPAGALHSQALPFLGRDVR